VRIARGTKRRSKAWMRAPRLATCLREDYRASATHLPIVIPRLKVLLVLGHPRRNSLCGALADAYFAGAQEAGVDTRRIDLRDLQFNPNVIAGSPRNQPLEPAIREALDLVRWADHLVFVFPTWWGTMPALMKGFLDRVLMPGFAFEEHEDGSGWDKLLTGRTAHLLTTMDTPAWVYRWIYKAPGLTSLARATLGFCGIAPVRTTIFGVVKDSDSATRARWLQQARAHGLRLCEGVLTTGERRRKTVGAWVAAMRLQFHPMAWGAYAIGAAGAVQASGKFDAAAFWVGLFTLFLLEVVTVFSNEYFDYESDRRNKNFGPFTGGSRVLVDGRISRVHMRVGIAAAMACFVAAVLALAAIVPATGLIALGLITVLALGYTTPPLKLCWRGLGELDVALTHSTVIVLCGFLFQGGAWSASFPKLVSAPLFLAVLPAIILSGVPDHAADNTAGKRSLAVLVGPRAAIRIAQATTVLAAATALLWDYLGVAASSFDGIGAFVVPHALVLTWLLERHSRRTRPVARIDGLMALALLYIVWFVSVPLYHLT
jgi:putative NADPH-quinone reductase/1,4-dihydroxy-2-naphthoate octaprenyltransferase